MAMKTSGDLSIKTAASTDGEINTNVSGVDSGSLVTLGQNSTAWTGGTAPPGGVANTSIAPYGMREYYGYQEYVPVSDSSVISTTNPGVFIRSIGGVSGQSMLSYGDNFYSDTTRWTSGTTPPSNFGYYSSRTSYYSGGGYQPTLSAQWRIKVVFDTYAGSNSGNAVHYIRLYIKDALNSYVHRDNSNNTRATHAANSYNSNSYSSNFPFYAVFDNTSAVVPDSWYIVLNCHQSAQIWPFTFSTFLGTYNPSEPSSGWPTNYTNGSDTYLSSTQTNYNMFFTNLTNNSISSGPTAWPLGNLTNRSVAYTGPISITHGTECSTSLTYSSIKLGLFVRKSGYEDALIYSTYLGHRGYKIWNGGYCL